jgi:sugar phosphate isomerase/epimerase
MRKLIGCLMFVVCAAAAAEVKWTRLSSKAGEIADPGGSNQQTGVLVGRFDKTLADGIVISYRVKGPALVWLRRTGTGWDRYVIENEFLTLEAGGATFDVDGDGDLDIVWGEDWQGTRVWWWENPFPMFDPKVSWKKHLIKAGGAKQHHDQIFGDFKGTGRPQLVFWNQGAKTLFIADVPADPKGAGERKLEAVFAGQAGEGVENAAKYAEGLDACDVDGDGRVDLLAGNYWFKHQGDGKFEPRKVGTIGGRIKGARFWPSKTAQIVIGPGDGTGPVKLYEMKGGEWVGRDLIGKDIVHGHTLEVGDVDGDGNLDIFAAEMAKWTSKPEEKDYPGATAWILYGDGKGGFRKTVLVEGDGWHEGRLTDLDGDGDLDVLNKPYTWTAPRVDAWLNNGTSVKRHTFKTHLGMELWTLRRELRKDLPGTLAWVRKLGLTDIETASFYGRTPQEFRKILDEQGMTCSSYITTYARLRDELENVAAEAKTVGAKYVLTYEIPRNGELTEADVLKAAAEFNRFGRVLKAQGIQFGYHPHGYEFVKTANGNLFDLLMEKTDRKLVTFEMDVFWFVHGGADPLWYLKKHPGRFTMVHLKEMARGTKTGSLAGREKDEASVAMGAGVLDWKAILPAAKKGGAKWYYIEDESPASAMQVQATLEYLGRDGW